VKTSETSRLASGKSTGSAGSGELSSTASKADWSKLLSSDGSAMIAEKIRPFLILIL